MPTTYYEWDPISDNIVAERDENGNVIVEYTTEPGYHGAVISEHRNGQTYCHHHDGQGNLRALTNDQGEVTDTFAYTANGELTERTGTTPTPYQYGGEHGYYTDQTTGEIMARRRDFDPAQGRWLSADPLGILDDPNLYRYVRNNPVMGIDPSGLLCLLQAVDCEGVKAEVLERLKGLIDEMKMGEPVCELPEIVCCPPTKPRRTDFNSPCTLCYRMKETDPIIYGGYDRRRKKIFICPGNATDQLQLDQTFLEEIQHFFDNCKLEGKFGFENPCHDKACVELRGKTFSGECDDPERRMPNESRDECLVRRISASLKTDARCKDEAEEAARAVLKDPKCKQLKPIPKPE